MRRAAADPRFARACIFLALVATVAFRVAGAGRAAAAAAAGEAVELELVQTVPVGTELGLDGLRDTHVVWAEMLDGARERVNLLQFYAVERPGEDPEERAAAGPTRLTPVVAALERAAERGVDVRFLADAGFHETYPDLLDRLDDVDGVEVRLYDLRRWTGGVQHAKALTVDGREGFVGSPNFDWRSLEHVQELGVRFEGPELVAPFDALFERDWAQSVADERLPFARPAPAAEPPFATADGGRVTPVMSPEGWLVDDLWDLPRLIALVDGAERDVALQFLSYYVTERDGDDWTRLDDALRRAAARGASVRLLLSHWATRESSLPALRDLHAVDGVRVRFLTVPEHEDGFIPFARVAHAKLIAVDGGAAGWVGTSNASGDYFHGSRNLGLLVEGGRTPRELVRYFEVGWGSEHAAPLDPERDYPEPRVGR